MKKENAINFLLYTYFGVTLEDNVDDKIKAAIIRAYGDATKEGAYNALFTKDTPSLGKLKEESNRAGRKSGVLIFNEIKKFFSSKENADYETWHFNLCMKLKENYKEVAHNGNCFFTFGNAQKWVNMTVKYICIMDSLKELSELHDQIEVNCENYHVPIDSYIIDRLWETNVPLPPKQEGEKERNRKTKYKKPSEYIKPWSKWDVLESYQKSAYYQVQNGIKELDKMENSILDWENEQWIIAAKNRKTSIKDVFVKNFSEDNNNNA